MGSGIRGVREVAAGRGLQGPVWVQGFEQIASERCVRAGLFRFF